LSWQGKGEQVIFGWKLFVQLIFNPLPPFMILTMGTTPVTAGMWNEGMLSAVIISTTSQHVGSMFLSASFHGPQSFFMTRQDGGFIFLEKALFKRFNN
jgi:hypothetical protein